MGMGMKSLKWEGIGTKNLFPHTSTADPSADERRSAASRTAIGGGISSRRPRGDNLVTSPTMHRALTECAGFLTRQIW